VTEASRIGTDDRSLLPQTGGGAMPWIIAAMMFLTTLAAAASLGLTGIAHRVGKGAAITVEIVAADAARREADAKAAAALLAATSGLEHIRRIPEAEIARTLEPWLGDVRAADITLPAIVEAERDASTDIQALRERLRTRVPAARLSTDAEWLAPLADLVKALRWLALAVLLLVAGAAGAVVSLAARAALETHKESVELLHLMGATDAQVAGLVQRRIALDAMWGSVVGCGAALLLLLVLRGRLAALGSELVGISAGLDTSWFFLLLVPAAGTLLAMLVARAAVFRALRQSR